jgi:hypothetical protein
MRNLVNGFFAGLVDYSVQQHIIDRSIAILERKSVYFCEIYSIELFISALQ